MARDGEEALATGAAALSDGKILALQGLGGFQLVVDAGDRAAVARLRTRKHRPHKPFAVMFPSPEEAEVVCLLDEPERRLLRSPQCPIVLVPRRDPSAAVLVRDIAPGNPNLGVMVPYTPLHHLLLRAVGRAVVATSGNLSGEPICIAIEEARARLGEIADLFLVHDRPILRPVDDSVVRVMANRPVVLRAARGYAPVTTVVSPPASPPRLATGAHLKNTVALSAGSELILSQHIGDLDAPETRELLRWTIADLCEIYQHRPVQLVHDAHPDYASTICAQETVPPAGHTVSAQHHHAHVVSCMVEHDLEGTVLGLSWDGTGLGPDGTIWGGEFLSSDRGQFERVAHFRTFPLPGGESAILDPCRTALGLLWACSGEQSFERFPDHTWSALERRILTRVLQDRINAPLTSAVGRLYDAVAALSGLQRAVSFEGQAAMAVEFAALAVPEPSITPYPFEIERGEAGLVVIDWRPLVDAILNDVASGVDAGIIAGSFQQTLVTAAATVVEQQALRRIVLTGGCFQNRTLTESMTRELRRIGCEVYLHHRVPPNDGGLAVGQAGIAQERTAECV
jgi:hydrogenase maturation protein HypF